MHMCIFVYNVYVCMYVCTYDMYDMYDMYVCMYVYIYIDREGDMSILCADEHLSIYIHV